MSSWTLSVLCSLPIILNTSLEIHQLTPQVIDILGYLIPFITYLQTLLTFQRQDQGESVLHGEMESRERASLLQRVYPPPPVDFANLHPNFCPRSNLSETGLLKVSTQTPGTEFS